MVRSDRHAPNDSLLGECLVRHFDLQAAAAEFDHGHGGFGAVKSVGPTSGDADLGVDALHAAIAEAPANVGEDPLEVLA